MGIGCYWSFPPEESGNTDGMLAPGKSFRYPLYETESDVRWSGTIWASTGCDEIDGCLTGVCHNSETGHTCPAYVGPGGPTTKAEFTLSDGYKDYYDVSAIDGTNLPMMIEPDDPVYPSAEESAIQHIKKVFTSVLYFVLGPVVLDVFAHLCVRVQSCACAVFYVSPQIWWLHRSGAAT